MKLRDLPPASLALRIYAGVLALGGVALLLEGPLLFGLARGAPDEPGSEWAAFAAVRVAGAAALGLAAFAMGLSQTTDRRTLLRGLNWFLAGQVVIWVVVMTQLNVVLGVHPTKVWEMASLAIVFGLAYIREAADQSARRRTIAAEAVDERSRYDQAIREAASQEERHRLARDLHDSIKQQIFAIQTSAATAEARLGADAAGAGEAIALVRSSAREAMIEMEAMLDQLRATPLDHAGLVTALRKQCEALGFRTGVAVEFTTSGVPDEGVVGPGARGALLRIAQEALANVARHARPKTVRVTLGASRDAYDLMIVDDGRGFDRGAASGGMGLHNMQSRADDVNGRLMVRSSPGTGTLVRVVVPDPGRLPAAADAAPGAANWAPWRSNILPWGVAIVIGGLVPRLQVATLVVASAWVLLAAWLGHRRSPRGAS